MFPSIADYYRSALERARNEIHGTEDARALGLAADEWTRYLIRKYGMEHIELDPGREPSLRETTTRGFPAVAFSLPVKPSDTLQVIFKNTLVGQSFRMIDYGKTFHYDHHQGTISIVVEQTASAIANGRAQIEEYIRSLSDAIEHENRGFPGEIARLVAEKQVAVNTRHKHLDDLARTVGIPIVTQSDVSKVIPTAVTVRREVAPLVPPTPKQPERLVLERDRFEAIIEVIDHQCRQFERTPGSFSVLTEEGLRDVLLSSLNAVLRGAATGETFQGMGKADIHLRVPEGEVFIAELKFWGGLASLQEATAQLLERLTWRDAYGVALILSRNADFGGVLRAIAEGIPGLRGVAAGSQRKVAEHRQAARFTLPSDTSRTVEVHVLAYNLYTPRTTPRTAR